MKDLILLFLDKFLNISQTHFKMFDEICRVLNPIWDNIVLLLWQVHFRHDKKDYFRFMDDAFEGTVEYSKYEIKVIQDYIDTFHSIDFRSQKWRILYLFIRN